METLFEYASEYAQGYSECGYDEDQIKSVRDAFLDGAKWQRNSVWHKPDEKPDEYKLILETDGKGAFWLHATNYMPLEENTRWAYLEDLTQL